MSIYLLVIFFILFVTHIFKRYSRAGRLSHAVPGPPAVPLLGNILQVANKSQVELWEIIQGFIMKYYPVFKGSVLSHQMFAILHPDDVKEIHHSRRKLISPAFNPNTLRKFIEITNKQGNNFIQRLRDAGDETIQNPKLILPRVTLNIICEWCMGVDLRTIEKESTEYQHAIQSITEFVLYRTFRPYILDWMIKFLNIGKRQMRAFKVAKSFVNKMLNDRRNYHASTDYKYLVSDDGTAVNDSLDMHGSKERQKSYCLMDLLLSAERDGLIDQKGIEEEVQSLIAAGFDTTSTVLLYTLMILAENKVAQDLARSEALDILENNGNGWTVELLQKLDYIDRCIKESMRLFPAVPFVVRTLQKDLHIRDYIIPAGSDSGISIYNIHRNPDFWPNPEQFDPDRFLPEDVKTRNPFAYLPFSAGFRSCIGQKFAMVQMKALIATILCNFQLEPVDKTNDIKFKMDFILSSNQSLHVKFIKLHSKY